MFHSTSFIVIIEHISMQTDWVHLPFCGQQKFSGDYISRDGMTIQPGVQKWVKMNKNICISNKCKYENNAWNY